MGALLGSAAQAASASAAAEAAALAAAEVAALSVVAAAAAPAALAATPSAPVRGAKGPVFNVYAQEIDPTNMMPSAANNAMSPGQLSPLPIERVKSTIPKGGVEGNWLYPSPQMFYNSLVRKNKDDGVDVADVPLVVQIHNEMNERTWSALLEWERGAGNGTPALRRFMGNPYALSPKSQVKAAFGLGYPFDRHDWYVDRGDRQIHYIIDYFFNPAGSAVPPGGPPCPLTGSIHVDVRPAINDFSSALHRLQRLPTRLAQAWARPRFVAEGIDPSKADPALVEEAKRHVCESNKAAASANAGEVMILAAPAPPPLHTLPVPPPPAPLSAAERKWADMDAQCAPLLHALKTSTDGDRAGRHVALNYCMGRVLCPDEAGDFLKQLESSKKEGTDGAVGGGEELSFNTMTQCIMRVGKKHHEAKAGVALRSGGGGIKRSFVSSPTLSPIPTTHKDTRIPRLQ